ncbi:hypothetical protein [Parasphingorhabdus halotolerans]|uniref:Uncharacterized protein n=1 Tax=Parasphingorhabdus halotolerans TaxID=2725558 RepID=A0A6H2DJ76_9SPHN|nr:hypothetical protein [Parasphingorhabdus halotolerans]QJB68248.1 hypothetical protein HF685_02135 [Parasphingorhabdus halotolerans]
MAEFLHSLEALASKAEFGRFRPHRVKGLCYNDDAKVELVFAHQKNRYDPCIHTAGIAIAQAKLTLPIFAYNFDRLIFHERCAAAG